MVAYSRTVGFSFKYKKYFNYIYIWSFSGRFYPDPLTNEVDNESNWQKIRTTKSIRAVKLFSYSIPVVF